MDIALWDDNPSDVDLLGFDAVVEPVLAAIQAGDLDPLTIGIHGPWGGGKSTILGLLESELNNDKRYIVVRTDPWEYGDQADVKGTLIAEILEALEARFESKAGFSEKVKDLMERISWSRVGVALAKGAITMQWDPKELVEAFTPQKKTAPRSMAGFRGAFAELLQDLPEVQRVVVLVDDLDRCLPGAVMASLEAIKLFLSVRKMVFVIAADRDMVRDAIAASLDASKRSERFAGRYLDKIVQLPVSLPRLAPHEAEAYITLLLARRQCATEEFRALVEHCRERRRLQKTPLVGQTDSLPYQPDEALLLLAGQLAHGLGSDRVTNPREIKRFLNAFGVRQRIAEARGLSVRPEVIAKLLLLEDRYRDAFDTLAGVPEVERNSLLARWEEWARSDRGQPPEGIGEDTRSWAAAEPSLVGEAIGPYITLAASLAAAPFGGAIGDELAELITRMTGPSEADRSLAIESLVKRSESDQRMVLQELFRQTRRTEDVTEIVGAAIGLAKANPQLAGEVAEGVAEHCWGRLDPGSAVDLVGSKLEPLVALARRLSTDPDVESDVREAAASALQEPVL